MQSDVKEFDRLCHRKKVQISPIGGAIKVHDIKSKKYRDHTKGQRVHTTGYIYHSTCIALKYFLVMLCFEKQN